MKMQILIIHRVLKKKRKEMRQPLQELQRGSRPCLACSDTTAGCPPHRPTHSTQTPVGCRTPILLLSASLQPSAADAKLHPHFRLPASHPTWLCTQPAHLHRPQTQWDAMGQEERGQDWVWHQYPWSSTWLRGLGCSACRDIPLPPYTKALPPSHTLGAPRAR